MKAIQSKRRLEKGAISRAYTFIQNPSGELDAEHIEARLNRLESAWKELQFLTGELYNFEEEAGFVDPENEIFEYEEKYLGSVACLKRILKSLNHTESTIDPHLDIFSRLAEQHSTLLQHLRPNLTAIQKFQYLKSLVKDDAANLIKHIQMSEGSYNTAWERLKERFDRPRHIVTSYIETFLGLPSMKEENSSLLRKIADTSNEVVRGLNAIDCNERDHWLIHILQGKIDSESRQKWFERSRDDIKPSLASLLEFLDQRCEQLELGAKGASKSTHLKRNPSTLFVSTNASQGCFDCGSAEHYIQKCPHFQSLPTEKCHSLVKKKNLCYNCMRKGHSVLGCKSQHKCRVCNRLHHTLLHFDQKDQKDIAHVASSEFSPRRLTSAEPHCPQPVSLNTVVTRPHTLGFTKNHLSHILPTALVDVRNSHGKVTTCRLLLDTASELSYITEDCIKRLGWPRTKSRITLTGISSIRAESTRGHCFIQIKSRNSPHTLSAQVHILGRITSSLPRSTVSPMDRKRLEAVHLADPSYYRSSPIDILLGADYVWDVITQEKLFDNAGNTIAISTIFGWVVTSVMSSTHNQQSSPSLIARIDKTLQAFWEIEEIDIQEKQSEEYTLVEKHFQQTYDRHPDGRYIVQLPFKEANPTFKNTYQGALARFKSTERRLSKNPSLNEKYCEFMEDYRSLGHMRELSSEEIEVTDGRLFYLPHHPIVGTKLRVVFDVHFKTLGMYL